MPATSKIMTTATRKAIWTAGLPAARGSCRMIRNRRSICAFAYTNRGSAYLDEGDFGHALADYNEAIRLDSKFDGTRGKLLDDIIVDRHKVIYEVNLGAPLAATRLPVTEGTPGEAWKTFVCPRVP